MTEANTKFIEEFVAAAKANDDTKMKEMAESVGDTSIQDRVDLLEQLVTALNKAGAEDEENKDTLEEISKGLAATRHLMQVALESQQSEKSEETVEEDSTSEEAKDDESKAEEATQDVAADTSADEAVVRDDSDVEKAAESGGYAPATEEEAEKDEEK